jgi:hypothetical protein
MAKMSIATYNTICIAEKLTKNLLLNHHGNGKAMSYHKKKTAYLT